MFDAISQCVVHLAALAAMAGAADILINDGVFRRGMRMLTGMFTVLEIAKLAYTLIF